MRKDDKNKFKKNILSLVETILRKEHRLNKKEADELIDKSLIERDIENDPYKYARLTPEQIVSGIINRKQ